MKRNVKFFLEDIIEQIELIEKSLHKKEDLLKNEDLRDATIRRLEVIGEAAKNIPENIRKKYPDIEWKKISGLRDIIIHTYFSVNLDIVWDIIKKNLPDLKEKISKIKEKLAGLEGGEEET